MSRLSAPDTQADPEAVLLARFRRLTAEWKKKSRFLSNTGQMAMLRPYQRIIGMGPEVVALILHELRREPDHRFWALEPITEQNPVPPEAMGEVRQMAQTWVAKGEHEGRFRADK